MWCFDYLLTFDREIQYFWRSSWSLNKVLFFGYRYPPLLYILINIFAIPPWPSWQNYHVSQSELFILPFCPTFMCRGASLKVIRWLAKITDVRSCAIVLYLQMALSIVGMLSAIRELLQCGNAESR